MKVKLSSRVDKISHQGNIVKFVALIFRINVILRDILKKESCYFTTPKKVTEKKGKKERKKERLVTTINGKPTKEKIKKWSKNEIKKNRCKNNIRENKTGQKNNFT